jgi:hypothetical protein
VKRAAAGLVVLVAFCATVLAVAPAASAATRECNGLQICVPIVGPWVVVPTRNTPKEPVEYQLDCPRGYIVGGLDAELSTRAIDLSFAGTLGSPVNPGITTAGSAVFSAAYVGLDTRASASFRPHIGCIPASGGGGRVPTAASAYFPPGHPTIRRVKNVRLNVGASRVSQGCAGGERLLHATHALGFYTDAPPAARLIAAVRTKAVLRSGRETVVVRAGKQVAGYKAEVQVAVVCAGGK